MSPLLYQETPSVVQNPYLLRKAILLLAFQVLPVSNEISISESGVISSTSNLTEGTYILDVTVSNESSSKVFENVFTLNVVAQPIAPSNLIYSVDSVIIEQGEIFTSVAPTLNGTSPLTFSLSNTTNLSIDNQGIISTTPNLQLGKYNLDVTASNSAGSETFNNAYVIEVIAPTTKYTSDVLPIIQANCGGCHPNYLTFNGAKSGVNSILDRIQRAQGSSGFMPRNGSPLPAAQIQTIQDWLNDGLIE